MRSGLKIVVAVGLYSLVETALLCTAMYSGRGGPSHQPNSYQMTVLLGQFLIIPGLGALLSRVNYGPHTWNRQTLAMTVVGLLTLPIMIAVLFGMAMLSEWMFPLGHEASADILTALVSLIVLIAGVLGGFVWVAKCAIKRGVELEANRWLTERQSGATQKECRGRTRGVQIASCIPAVLVLSVFLFLPRVWAFVSHVELDGVGKLEGFEVSVPVHWIITDHVRREDGWSFVDGIILEQNTFALLKGRSPRLPLSAWYVSTEPYEKSKAAYSPHWNDQFIAKRVFELANESVICLEYPNSYIYGSAEGKELSAVHVQCTSSGRLGGSYTGYRDNLQTFYQMLQGIQHK